jgi:ADP-dependent glucokinase
LFDTIVNIASRIEGSHFALGGNAPVMAKRFGMEGCEVLLAAKMTPELQESLPEGVTGKLKDQFILFESILHLKI